MTKKALALDLGASSGRAMIGEFDGTKISLSEAHRFENNPVMLRGTFYWDILNLFHEIKQGLVKANQCGGFDTIGVDTWGVDFGLLDNAGNLMQNPVHYRDLRTSGMVDEVCGIIGRDALYNATGSQFLELNTIFQLYALAKSDPELLRRARHALLMSNLFDYFLTGKMAAEYSIASTTQLMDPHAKTWNKEIMRKLGIPEDLFPDIVKPGSVLGTVGEDVQQELGLNGKRVVSVTGHDTACAVAAVPAAEKDFIYISCGTWSIFGTELARPIIGEKSLAYNITNEGGYDSSIRFSKNIVGLWLIQETRRQYRREGKEYSYAELERQALESEPFRYFIDPDAQEFVPPGNLPRRIREYCERTGQGKPQSVGEIVRCIYESIAMKYRLTYGQIQDCTGKQYRHIHIIGGGTKDQLLCQMTANSTGCPVIAGPIEATALGNIIIQLMAEKEIGSLEEARGIVRNSFRPATYQPADTIRWDDAYTRFYKLTQ